MSRWAEDLEHSHRALQFDPAAVKAVVKKEPCQVSHTHIPHRFASRDDKDETIFLSEPDVMDNHLNVLSQKEFIDCSQ